MGLLWCVIQMQDEEESGNVTVKAVAATSLTILLAFGVPCAKSRRTRGGWAR